MQWSLLRGAREIVWIGSLGLALIGWSLNLQAAPPLTSTQTVATQPATTQPVAIKWETDYGTATQRAVAEKKYLLILFESPTIVATANRVEAELQKPNSSKDVEHHVFCRLPTNTTITVAGKPSVLLTHGSFSELRRGPGIAVIDQANAKTEHFGRVVNQLPFTAGKYYNFSPAHIGALLSLPSGTLTQRSMIFAVRIHPEAPQSTRGDHNVVLRDEAHSHSQYQAAIRNQGHHQWGSRFQRIIGRLAQVTGRGSAPREVVAESWPNQGLMDSCVDCVASWRQSSGHWGAVRAPHNAYAYDIRQGANGIWYATGLFSE